jgi:hypothetical protein
VRHAARSVGILLLDGCRTSNSERFNPDGLTAASHDYAINKVINVTNPSDGRACTGRVNDRGPYESARYIGVRIDFARGAARCLGMSASTYICAPEPQLLVRAALNARGGRPLQTVVGRIQVTTFHVKSLRGVQLSIAALFTTTRRLWEIGDPAIRVFLGLVRWHAETPPQPADAA